MEMLLRHVTMAQLAGMYRRNGNCSPAPHLRDAKAVARARRLAKRNGVWEDLSVLDPAREIPVIKRSDYRRFRRDGDRQVAAAKAGVRRRELDRAAMALWMDHPKADIDYLQDLLWAYCDDWTWVINAHEGKAIDLGSAMLGARLAEILHVLGDRLEDEVTDRVARAIERHLFEPFWDYRHMDDWKTTRMNWNHVCNGEVIRAALYRIDDPEVLAHMTHAAIQNLTYAIDGFAGDGGCLEGPGYWGYGFGHFLLTAHALSNRTGGELNIVADSSGKIARICRYPLAAYIGERFRSTFADSGHGYISAHTAMIINAFDHLPELYALCARHPDRTLKVQSMHELALYSGFKAPAERDQNDYLLPDLGQVKLRGAPGRRQMTLMALAGNNGVPHNHNDIGSFIVHKHGKMLLVDPGAPVYRRKTFGPDRYDIIFCSALGHSVPVIDGVMQQAGSEYFGTLAVENLNGEGTKRAVIDMTHAYPKGTVQRLIRTFEFDATRNTLVLEDAYEFRKTPQLLEEAFITFERVRVSNGSVQIGAKTSGLTLVAESCAGRFDAVRMVEESKEGRTDDVITRIRFTPDTLARRMTLRFRIA